MDEGKLYLGGFELYCIRANCAQSRPANAAGFQIHSAIHKARQDGKLNFFAMFT
jgi:hypothetical protein